MSGLRAACLLALLLCLVALSVAWFRAGGDPARLAGRMGDSCLRYGLGGYAAALHLAAAHLRERAVDQAPARGTEYRAAAQVAAAGYLRAGDILTGLGERAGAAAAYAHAVRVSPWDDRARVSLAAAQPRRDGSPPSPILADLAFRRNSPAAQLALARDLVAHAQPQAALPLLRRAAASPGLPADMRLPIARAAADAGDLELAGAQASLALRRPVSLREALEATRLLAAAGLPADPWDRYALLALRDYGVTLLGTLLYCVLLAVLLSAPSRRPRPLSS